MSLASSEPSTRNSTRAIVPSLSAADAEMSIDAGAVYEAPGNGIVIARVGRSLARLGGYSCV